MKNILNQIINIQASPAMRKYSYEIFCSRNDVKEEAVTINSCGKILSVPRPQK